MSQPAMVSSQYILSEDEESNHEDASDTGAAPKQQQQVIPQTTAISNIKLPILKKEEYDIWAMEIEHYLEYIDKKFGEGKFRNGITPKKRNLTGERMVEANIKNISSEGLDKGYDRFQQLLSQLEAHGAKVSTEDANHKFLRSLPAAWSNLAMTMRTKPEVDTLSIDDLYNNLRVFEQEIQGASKTSLSAQNVPYSTCHPSTSSTNIPKKEVLAGFADEVIYSLFAKQSEDWDLLHEDLENILMILDIESGHKLAEIAMIVLLIRMKKFYKKTEEDEFGGWNKHVGFDKIEA
ncbi:hypothetical protein Tco_0526704 [Tanacetum coccineum]